MPEISNWMVFVNGKHPRSPNSDGSQFARFAFTQSTHRFVRFFSSGRSSLHKTVWHETQYLLYVCCVATSHYNAPGQHFFELLSQPFLTETSKYANLQNHRVLDLTSHPALDPCPVKLGPEPKWRRFDVLWRALENQGFNQIEKSLRQITPQNKLYYFSEKNFEVRRTLMQSY